MPRTPGNDLSNSTSAKSVAFKYALSCTAAMVAETGKLTYITSQVLYIFCNFL